MHFSCRYFQHHSEPINMYSKFLSKEFDELVEPTAQSQCCKESPDGLNGTGLPHVSRCSKPGNHEPCHQTHPTCGYTPRDKLCSKSHRYPKTSPRSAQSCPRWPARSSHD